MDGTNSRTLESYQAHVAEYISGTSHEISGAVQDWIDASLNGLPTDAAILEIGSAFGRDAEYIQSLGYGVQCTDATPAFVEHLNSIGFPARSFNALADRLEETYDLIFADAVLLHFDRSEFAHVLASMFAALNWGGRFAFCLKRGDGEKWSTHKLNAPRYFCYWQPEELPGALSHAGFQSWTIDTVEMDRTHADWIFVIARK